MTNQRWIDEKKVMEITGRKLPTLRNDRFLGRGIPYSKMGKSVRYEIADVVNFMKSRRVSTSDAQ